jgi:hypothetical protein
MNVNCVRLNIEGTNIVQYRTVVAKYEYIPVNWSKVWMCWRWSRYESMQEEGRTDLGHVLA